ncbi:MAG: hypothetical protein BZ135_00195 [Methanosphaera sp. rholeuAM6]|nr:MAG: hypothetical protein BZ135_00195 [Methanosphaera sp. rholeuAM6]
MRINKLSMLLIILFSFLILSNTIYASDIENNENTNPTNEEQTGQITQGNPEVNVYNIKSDTELRNAFDTIKTSEDKYHEINLKKRKYNLYTPFDTSYANSTEKIITINGNDSTLSGKNLNTKLINVNVNVTLSIKNITFANSKHEMGIIYNMGTLIIEDSLFENNTSQERTDGYATIFNNGNLYLKDTIFQNNSGIKGSAIYSKTELVNDTIVNIDGCIFENNYAIRDSTIMNIDETDITINNTVFKNNIVNNDATITNIKGNLTIENSILTNEQTPIIINNQKDCYLNNVSITDNELSTTVIENYEKMTINSSNITNNKVNNSSIINNKNENSQLIFNDTLFENNTSLDDGYGINSSIGHAFVYNSKFYNNTFSELFKETSDNFIEVENNDYLDNNLKSYIELDYSNIEDNITINGSIKTDDIYNTTVNVGKIYLYQDENLLSMNDINDGDFNISSEYNENSNLTLKLIYLGENHFNNQIREIHVSDNTGEYIIYLQNLPEEFVYGDTISYDVVIKNTGNTTVNSIQLQYLIPNELTLVNSSNHIDNSGICTISNLGINESENISINATPKLYEDLNLNFNIYDVNKNNYTIFEENIEFINPSITLNNLVSYIGDTINITATINNYNKDSISDIKFKFQYKEINDIQTKFENKTLTILNYKLNDNITAKTYNIAIICDDDELESEFSNKSKISVSKLDTYSSIINYNISNNYVNLSSTIYDSNNNLVTNGSMIVKINGRSVRSVKITNGTISINDLFIDKKYQKDEYEILLVYTGNNKYFNHKNSTKVNLLNEDTSISFSYEISDNTLRIIPVIKGASSNIKPSSGYVVFKINGKSVSSKIDINDLNVFEYNISDLNNILDITVSYYGNNIYNPNSLTLSTNNY